MTQPANQMTLHDAIQEVLRDHPHTWMTAAEIADEIAQRHLYLRGDGQPPSAANIHVRINQYPQLFEADRSRSPMRFRLH